MAEDFFRGPTVNVGSLMDGRVEPFDGPDISYQGEMIPDPRFSPINKDGMAPARVKGFYSNPYFVLVDAIPSITSTTTVAAAQTPSTTAAVALNLATAVTGTAANVTVWTPSIPIIPVGTTSVVTVSAIDFGFCTGTTAANSSTVVVTDNTQFYQGQWIVIGGGTSPNKALITQVTSISTSNVTTITVSPSPNVGSSNLPIGQGNLYSQFLPPSTSFGPAAASASATEPYRLGGLANPFDPAQGVARNLTVTAASIGSGTTALICTGYDLYGNLMAELITASGTTTVAGKKAFKYISNIKVNTGATSGTPAQVSVGLGDVLGINLRNDKWEYLNIFFNGGFAINNTGWSAAITSVATNTTGDVRGAQNMSTILAGGTGGTAVAGGGFDGVKRVTMFMTVPMMNMLNSNPNSVTSLVGVAQATA